MFKSLVRRLLQFLYKIEASGLEHWNTAGDRVLIVANHLSYLDAVLLWAFLPGELTFPVNTYVARKWWVKFGMACTPCITLDPTNPLSARSLIAYLEENRKVALFPEGRRTTTGGLMKIYDGAGLIADKSGATLLPVRIDGPQHTPFACLLGQPPRRWFPAVRLVVLPPTRLRLPEDIKGRARRRLAGQRLAFLMADLLFRTADYRRTLWDALLEARRIHGGSHVVLEDVDRRPATYNQIVLRTIVLGKRLEQDSRPDEVVGLLLPNSVGALLALLGLQRAGRLPAMLNYSAGSGVILQACATAQVRTVITSRRFVEQAKRQALVESLATTLRVLYLEDLAADIPRRAKLGAVVELAAALRTRQRPNDAEQPAVILFTSGTEGAPKGVVLSHANLLANRAQVTARLDFGPRDTVLNALPMFHSFGLTVGTLLPLLAGARTFLYPTPLHYRIVPELAYDTNTTILLGTNTFLAGYAKFAHPYDFYNVRYVFAGAEKLTDAVRQTWASRFGLRILEGYGATETSPALSLNTALACREGSVGTLLPGVEHRIVPVAGIEKGGRLHVSGPNVMLGYWLAAEPGKLVPPHSEIGSGWYDTGDIVEMDADGYLHIQGRAKRFAKVSGEMVSLVAVEELAERLWPARRHAAVALPDAARGEQVVLLSENPSAELKALLDQARREGIGDLLVPKRLLKVTKLALLPSGKVDYQAAAETARRALSDA